MSEDTFTEKDIAEALERKFAEDKKELPIDDLVFRLPDDLLNKLIEEDVPEEEQPFFIQEYYRRKFEKEPGPQPYFPDEDTDINEFIKLLKKAEGGAVSKMTEEQMRKLMESDADRTTGFTPEQMDEMQRALDEQDKREEEETKEEFSPGLEEDRTAPLREEPVEEKPEGRQASDQLVGEFVASLMGDKKEESTVMAAEGGSIEREADFVKDDDEEPADPPPGATPEEVADDVPAYLSTGEYVLPANVVRYLGLERIVSMHKGALAALQQMEDLDIIENVDENGMVEEDDDEMDYLKEPKGVVKTTLVVAKPHPSGMMAMPFQQGGDIGDAMQESFEQDQRDQYGDIGDAMQEAEDAPPPGGGDAGGGLTEPAPGTKAREEAEKGFQKAQEDRGFFERLDDALYDLSKAPFGTLGPVASVSSAQLKQHMINNPDLTKEEAMEELQQFNKGRAMSISQVAAAAGPTAAVMQGLMNKLEEMGATLTPTPEFDQRQEDRGFGPSGDADDTDPIAKQAAQDETKDTAKKLIEELEESKGGKRYKVDPVEALRFGQLGEEYTRGSFFQR